MRQASLLEGQAALGNQGTKGMGGAVPCALLGVILGFVLTAPYLSLRSPVDDTPDTRTELAPPAVVQVLTEPKPDEPGRPEIAAPAGSVPDSPLKNPSPYPLPQSPQRGEGKQQPLFQRAAKAPPVVQKTPFDRNYASSDHGATATGGQRSELLLDGKTSNYDGSLGFAHTTWNSGKPQHFVIALQQPVTLNVVRFLLWDKDNRFYRYKLEASADAEDLGGDHWFTLADRSAAPTECRGWQAIVFRPCTIARLKLTGTYNSANSGFHVVELEAYHIPGGLDFPWVEPEF